MGLMAKLDLNEFYHVSFIWIFCLFKEINVFCNELGKQTMVVNLSSCSSIKTTKTLYTGCRIVMTCGATVIASKSQHFDARTSKLTLTVT